MTGLSSLQGLARGVDASKAQGTVARGRRHLPLRQREGPRPHRRPQIPGALPPPPRRAHGKDLIPRRPHLGYNLSPAVFFENWI